jgi:hypothetical protein
MNLSEHRVQEIFANVKQNASNDTDPNSLDADEFLKALEYLDSKTIRIILENQGLAIN